MPRSRASGSRLSRASAAGSWAIRMVGTRAVCTTPVISTDDGPAVHCRRTITLLIRETDRVSRKTDRTLAGTTHDRRRWRHRGAVLGYGGDRPRPVTASDIAEHGHDRAGSPASRHRPAPRAIGSARMQCPGVASPAIRTPPVAETWGTGQHASSTWSTSATALGRARRGPSSPAATSTRAGRRVRDDTGCGVHRRHGLDPRSPVHDGGPFAMPQNEGGDMAPISSASCCVGLWYQCGRPAS